VCQNAGSWRVFSLKEQFSGLFRALRSRNFRLFFAGQSLSLVGTWMQRVAMGWLVYRLTLSPSALGLVDFVSQIGTFLLGFFAGTFVDRTDLRRLLVWTQALAMAQAFVLAGLVLTGRPTFWAVLVCGAFLGMINAFDIPARNAFVIRMVEKKEDLGNAIALNSTLFSLARLLGPSIAGFVIAAVGEGICFLLNGLSYFSIILALGLMKLPPAPKVQAAGPTVFSGTREGLLYAWKQGEIRAILGLLCCLSLFGFPYVVMMPVFAREILHGGPRTLGLLMGATGSGALAGALLLASRKDGEAVGRFIPILSTVFAASVIGMALVRHPMASYGFVASAGFGMITIMAVCNTVLQTLVCDRFRGRVLSLFMMSLVGIAPFGSLIVGWLSERFGICQALAIGGGLCLVASILFWRRNAHERIHGLA
jgi:MFS family permease